MLPKMYIFVYCARGPMKIEHVAIWVKDIDKVCEFYRKYFDGVVQPLYHNPAKQFTSRFINFEDGARLEVMHRPDIVNNDIGTSTDSNVGSNVGAVTKLQSNTHRSANEKMQAFFRFLTSVVFHVKQLQTEEAAGNSFTDISEVQQVGSEGANTASWLRRSKHDSEARHPTSRVYPSFLFRWFKRKGGPPDQRNVGRWNRHCRTTPDHRRWVLRKCRPRPRREPN